MYARGVNKKRFGERKKGKMAGERVCLSGENKCIGEVLIRSGFGRGKDGGGREFE